MKESKQNDESSYIFLYRLIKRDCLDSSEWEYEIKNYSLVGCVNPVLEN